MAVTLPSSSMAATSILNNAQALHVQPAGIDLSAVRPQGTPPGTEEIGPLDQNGRDAIRSINDSSPSTDTLVSGPAEARPTSQLAVLPSQNFHQAPGIDGLEQSPSALQGPGPAETQFSKLPDAQAIQSLYSKQDAPAIQLDQFRTQFQPAAETAEPSSVFAQVGSAVQEGLQSISKRYDSSYQKLDEMRDKLEKIGAKSDESDSGYDFSSSGSSIDQEKTPVPTDKRSAIEALIEQSKRHMQENIEIGLGTMDAQQKLHEMTVMTNLANDSGKQGRNTMETMLKGV
ncbi:hypothetical protein [Aestuariispira insulae]|uniref:Uncharacterized protein n=1 Tax=Aestuariispira insulae TaxID=1461337 RepID=A0A3D9H2F3_9PROT|nr:hypothetical protein [Aestuariispira insulae]RED43697.1 hypothetical protein DFP90_1218 [Aestuariispira insulae]